MNKLDEILNSEENILDELEDLFDDLSADGPTKDEMYKMYGVFLNDIVNNPIIINGIKLKYNKTKSKHPVCKGKMVVFEHIITRESKYNGKRHFDKDRANKIHWIRPIIENKNDARIKYFERINDKGYNQQFYWYEEKGFIVIIRELDPDLFLITSFSIDKNNKQEYKNYYNEYRDSQK
ncbi:MAG: hypothetical protein JXL97_17300 [Bacteroidales bacterium]|nr:hypothetical protein [Bacteroidales bacterium]